MSKNESNKKRGSSPLFRTFEEISGSKGFEGVLHQKSHKYANETRHCLPAFGDSPTPWNAEELTRNKVRNMIDNDNRLPRLVKPKKENKDQRWVVVYYLWNPAKGKYERKRNYSLNSEPEKDRHTAFIYLKKQLLKRMEESEFSVAVPKDIKQASIYKALELYLQSKKQTRSQTYEYYAKCVRNFEAWIKSQAFQGGVANVTPVMCRRYVEYLSMRRNVGNRTIKNYVDGIKTAFNEWKTAGVIQENPWKTVKMPAPDEGKNIAYTHEQVRELLQYMKHSHTGLYRLCTFMYYTLARPNELSHLQIKHIGMNRPDQIYLPSEFSKNRAARHIIINADFRKFIEESGIMDLPKEWYIFGKGFMPGAEYYKSKNYGTRYRRAVLNKLKYDSDYTLYSWKHTGVVHAYLNGMSPASIQMQIGHLNQGSFEAYLRSLGLFENTEIHTKFPALPT